MPRDEYDNPPIDLTTREPDKFDKMEPEDVRKHIIDSFDREMARCIVNGYRIKTSLKHGCAYRAPLTSNEWGVIKARIADIEKRAAEAEKKSADLPGTSELVKAAMERSKSLKIATGT